MKIIGFDFHTRYQQIAMAREETGELLVQRRLNHESGEAHAFYRSLQSSDGRPGRKTLERIWVPHTSVLRVGLLTFPRLSIAISS